ncbi:formate dehydrogenase (NAD+) [Microbotryomycetes sp. JL221]|nr:formate dehydrogenase (NAD+) [Microbotryomycetes sp. JL221]
MTVDGRQQLRLTAATVIRQLEQQAASTTTTTTRVQQLKLQATLKHANQLIQDLQDQGEPVTNVAPLKQRLSKVQLELTTRQQQQRQSTKSKLTTAASNTTDNNPNTQNNNNNNNNGLDLDFLAPSVPLFPTLSISPSSSPGPSSTRPGRSSGGGPSHLSLTPPTSYSPIPFSQPVDHNQYASTSTQTYQDTPQWGIDTSVKNRDRTTSSASKQTNEYDPDDYSPSRSKKDDNEQVVESRNTMLDERERRDSSFDFDAPPRIMDDQDDEFDPESGQGYGADHQVSRSRSNTKTSIGSIGSALSPQPPPPPRRKSSTSSTLNAREQLLGSELKSRPRTYSNMSNSSSRRRSTTSNQDEQDQDVLKSTGQATSSDLLSHHHDLQNSLMSSLTDLSSQLKTSTLAFSSNLDKDKQIMLDAQNKLEQNHDKLKLQGSRVGVVRKKTRGTTCWTIGAILLVQYDGGKHAEEEPKLLGTRQNALGLPKFCKEKGWELVVTSDKEGDGCEADKHIVDADVVISSPFWPYYVTKERIDKAKNLKLVVTAGVGSDHVDLNAANERKITVAEVTGSNVVSVAEHVVMTILILVRNYGPAHEQALNAEWDIAAVARDTYDLEGKVVGTIGKSLLTFQRSSQLELIETIWADATGAGRIGYRVLQRLKAFDCKELLYYDYQNLPADAEKQVGARRVEDLKDFLSQCDVVTLNCPLHEGSRGMINKETLSYMKKGAWIVNTARGALCVEQDVADALKSGHIRGYGGDVWNVQPAPKEHPWHQMTGPRGIGNAMTVHISGTSLDAQARYAAGTIKIIENWHSGSAQNPADLIVENGDYATKAYGQRQSKAAPAS